MKDATPEHLECSRCLKPITHYYQTVCMGCVTRKAKMLATANARVAELEAAVATYQDVADERTEDALRLTGEVERLEQERDRLRAKLRFGVNLALSYPLPPETEDRLRALLETKGDDPPCATCEGKGYVRNRCNVCNGIGLHNPATYGAIPTECLRCEGTGTVGTTCPVCRPEAKGDER